jgi:hypothetical protein
MLFAPSANKSIAILIRWGLSWRQRHNSKSINSEQVDAEGFLHRPQFQTTDFEFVKLGKLLKKGKGSKRAGLLRFYQRLFSHNYRKIRDGYGEEEGW